MKVAVDLFGVELNVMCGGHTVEGLVNCMLNLNLYHDLQHMKWLRFCTFTPLNTCCLSH